MVFLNGKMSTLNIIFLFPSVLCCDFFHGIWINVENWEYSGLLGFNYLIIKLKHFLLDDFFKTLALVCVLNSEWFSTVQFFNVLAFQDRQWVLSWSARYHYFGVNFNLIFQEISLVLSEIIFILSKYSVLWGEVKF